MTASEHLRMEATAALAADLYDAARRHSLNGWVPFDQLAEWQQQSWHGMARIAYRWFENRLTDEMQGDPR